MVFEIGSLASLTTIGWLGMVRLGQLDDMADCFVYDDSRITYIWIRSFGNVKKINGLSNEELVAYIRANKPFQHGWISYIQLEIFTNYLSSRDVICTENNACKINSSWEIANNRVR